MRVVYSLIWILSIAAHSVVAQEIRNDGVSMSVYFDNGFSSVDHGPDRRELVSLAQRLRALYIDDIISEITVKGWSSPNGLPENNVRLAEARARNTAEYLAMKADIPRSLFKVEGCGIDWSEIEKAAAETTDMPYRDEVLRVLDDDSALRRHNLIHLQEGKPYKYLYARVFPSLRRADISAAVTVEICSTPPAQFRLKRSKTHIRRHRRRPRRARSRIRPTTRPVHKTPRKPTTRRRPLPYYAPRVCRARTLRARGGR